ncbi:hypothetical protein Smar_1439 [Staphylothermus marinus F1]|uniref:S-layer protein n=1 Tax=Staphylothermus marinus (strain ATCC 43588 / DSM 3639 / JCM 9404 / F1) TaxID=399550 RepID=A3DPG9_STAMF|nr:hypothetical protein [Staphylothermus marinus]ABN70529.1 hypothetical protein Smar_1439 [Staphylothermus marinus F1]
MKLVFRLISIIILISIFLSMYPIFHIGNTTNSLYSYFEIKNVKFRSSTGGDVYPGSRNAVLLVDAMYYSNSTINASNIYSCIDLPEGFSVVTSSCSIARDFDGNIVEKVSPGEMVRFQFGVDVDKNVSPGTYSFNINITYTFNNTLMSEQHVVVVEVKPYPRLSISFRDSYFTPYGYPGANPVTLVIELENTGNSTIRYADVKVELPSFIEINNPRTSISNIPPNQVFTISLNNLAISPNARPGKYVGYLNISAQMITSDGVVYNDNIMFQFNITIERAPPYNYSILDYGLSTNHPLPGSRNTRFYVLMQSIDASTIDTLVAKVTINNGYFMNGSNTEVVVIRGPINYGDTFTLTTDPISIINSASHIIVEIMFNGLIVDNGASYWVNWSNTFYVKLNYTLPKIDVFDVYWSNNKVYPGSIDQDLRVIMVNNDYSDVVDGVAILSFEEDIFYPQSIVVDNVVIPSNSYTTLTFSPIDISNNARPGNYTAKLSLFLLLRNNDGSYSNIVMNYTLIIQVSDPYIDPINILNYHWGGGKAYSGEKGASLNILEQVVTDTTIDKIYAVIYYPNGITSENTGDNYDTYIVNNPLTYGDIFSLNYNAINISSNITGTTYIVLKQSMLVTIDGSQTWLNKTYVIILTISEPALNITLIDKGWTTDTISPSADNVGLYLTFQSFSQDTIREVIFKLYLPNKVYGPNGEKEIIRVINNNINYLQAFTVTFNGLNLDNIESDHLVFNLSINAVMEHENGVYEANKSITVFLSINSPFKPLIVLGVRTTYQGQPSPLLPNSNGEAISFVLLNNFRNTISSLKAELESPSGIEVIGSNTQFINNLLSGSSTTISYMLRVGNITPGTYTLKLNIEMIIDSNGALVRQDQTIYYNITIEDPSKYVSRILLIRSYWGTTTPSTIYPGDKKAPLTLTFLNIGEYTVYAFRSKLIPMDKSIKVLNNDQVCNTLAVGSTCTVTFYLDLQNTSAGMKEFIVKTSYLQGIYGSYNNIEKEYNIKLDLPSFNAQINNSSIYLVSSGWNNNWPVYPRSEKTIYTVTLANLEPYSIGSIVVKILPPNNIVPHNTYDDTYYVEGPIPSLQTFTASFTLDVGDIDPGIYDAKIIVDYYVYANNGGYRKSIIIPVVLEVKDPEKALTTIQYGWLGGQPPLVIHGATYYFIIRNNEIPSMNGIYFTGVLPENITYSITDTRLVNVTPQVIIPSIQASQNLQQQLATFLIQQSMPSRQSAGLGDYLSFTLKLNLNLSKPYYSKIHGAINFIDHWGSVHVINISIPFIVVGKPLEIDILPKTPLIVFDNGTGYIDLVIDNPSKNIIYDTYILLIPASMNAIPLDNIKYIGTILSQTNKTIRYMIIYNPVSISYGGASVSSLTVSFRANIIYRDISGSVNILNTTVAARVAPFIDLEISPDITVRYSSGELVVNGLIINYGVSSARSVYVKLIYENYSTLSFIGDIDPASQAAFRLETKMEKPPTHNITLIIGYRDDYNGVYEKEISLPVQIVEEAKTPIPTAEKQDYTIYYIIVTVMVGVFLSAIFYVLHKYMKKKIGMSG